MSDLIDRDEVIEIIESVCSADDTYWQPGTLEKIRNLPTHPTLSNTLGALDCIDRQKAIKALCREECGMDPKECCVGTCYDVEIIEHVPSVQLELSNNSLELENKNGELISRQAAIDEIDEWIKAFRENGHKESAADACLIQDGIIQLPSVQPDKDLIHLQKEQAYMQGYEDGQKPRKGKWIKGDCNVSEYRYFCSKCKAHHRAMYDYCPSCGADMREGDSDDR